MAFDGGENRGEIYLGNERLKRDKEKILSLVRVRGPSLPVQIAKGIGAEPIFAAAFLSELYGEKKLKMTNMRVGSSPLYYLEGQEAMLENFIEYLNPREKEAFLLLRRENVLADESQEPVTRVALRAIKDFAIPIRVKINEDTKLFWKYFLLSDSEIRSILKRNLAPEKEEIAKEVEKETAMKEKISEEKKETGVKVETNSELKEAKIKRKKKVKIKDSEFSKKIKEHIIAKDIEILDILLDKKKEFAARVRIDMPLGKQEMLLVAKDKKIITNNDLSLVLQKSQDQKMPAILMTCGELNKKAEEYLRSWKNLIKFDKLNF